MAYSRRTVKDFETIMNKDLYDNLQDGIEEALGKTDEVQKSVTEKVQVLASTHNVETYSSLEQLEIEEGTETLQVISMALPDTSKLQMKVTENHNTSIYPSSGEGILIAKKADNYCKFEYVDISIPAKWLCASDITTDEGGEQVCTITKWEKISTDSEHNVKTYTSFEQIGLVVGEETIESIVNALPEGSMLAVAISTDNNTEIYPKDSGLLRVTKNTPDIKFEFNWFTSGAAPTMWEGIYYTETSEWYGWSRHYGLGISEEEVLNILLKYGSLPIDKGGTGATNRTDALGSLMAVGSMINTANYSYLGEITTNGVYQVSTVHPDNPPNSSNYGILLVFQINGYTQQFYQSTNDTDSRRFYVRTSGDSGSTWGDWINLADASKYLPLDGSVPMSGKLRSIKKDGTIGMNSSDSVLRIDGGTKYNDGAFLSLHGVNENSSDKGAFQLVANGDKRVELRGSADGKLIWNGGNIYGEHNITSGTTNLTAGTSTLASGSIYLQYE